MAFAQLSLADSSLGPTAWAWGGVSSADPLTYSNQLWTLSTSSASWTLKPSTGGPPRAVGAAMCALGGTLYLFGGLDASSSLRNTVYTFDTAFDVWALPGTLGSTPAARAYHAMACSHGRVYLFGGQGAASTLLSDMHHLDTRTLQWTAVGAAGAPSARKGHTITQSGERLYVFGGGGAGGARLNDAYSFDVGASAWRALQTSGELPSAREGHAAAVMDERLYIYGGVDRNGQLNDVHALSLASLRWTQPRVSGASPPPRWGMMAVLASETLYVYGGVAEQGGSQQMLSDLWRMSTRCEGTTLLTATRASFSSGDTAYSANSNCSWLIAPPGTNQQVRLFFSSFKLEASRDFVTVREATGGALLGSFSGFSLPLPVVSRTGGLLVTFTSDATVSSDGFSASYFTECDAGFYTASIEGTCLPCAVGTYSSTPGQTSCTACPTHQYAAAEGSASCTDCPLLSRAPLPAATSRASCLCLPYHHQPNGSGTDCVACPFGAYCAGGAAGARSLAGYCQVGANDFLVCCDASACAAGGGSCPEGAALGPLGKTSCETEQILSMAAAAFFVVVGVLVAAVVLCYCAGFKAGERRGARLALRSFMQRLKREEEVYARVSTFSKPCERVQVQPHVKGGDTMPASSADSCGSTPLASGARGQEAAQPQPLGAACGAQPTSHGLAYSVVPSSEPLTPPSPPPDEASLCIGGAGTGARAIVIPSEASRHVEGLGAKPHKHTPSMAASPVGSVPTSLAESSFRPS